MFWQDRGIYVAMFTALFFTEIIKVIWLCYKLRKYIMVMLLTQHSCKYIVHEEMRDIVHIQTITNIQNVGRPKDKSGIYSQHVERGREGVERDRERVETRGREGKRES